MIELRYAVPRTEQPLRLNASITTALNEVHYQAYIIKWIDKKALFNPQSKTLHDEILDKLNTYQPKAGRLFPTKGRSKYAILLVIKNLKKVSNPFQVYFLIPNGNGETLKNRSRPGMWNLVMAKEDTLNCNIVFQPIYKADCNEGVTKSIHNKHTRRLQQRLSTAQSCPKLIGENH